MRRDPVCKDAADGGADKSERIYRDLGHVSDTFLSRGWGLTDSHVLSLDSRGEA